MATGAGKKQSREALARSRAYHARQEFHEGLLARRRRDNLVAGVAGGALILAVIGGQVAYYTLGPGSPEPVPTPTATPTTSATPAASDSPTPDTTTVSPESSTPAP